MSDYSDLFEDPKPNPSLAVRLNADANPVQEAEYLKLAKRYSVPVPVIRSAPDDYKARAKAEDVDLFTEKAPVLRSWLSEPDKARLAATDAKNLADVEKSFDRTVFGTAGDVGVTALKSAVGLPQAVVGLADIVTGGYAGKGLEALGVRFKDTQEILDTLYSPAQQAANKRVSEADGFTDALAAMVQNPSTIATAVGESLFQMLGGAGIARGVLGFGAKTLGAGMTGPALPGLLARQFGDKTATLLASAFGEGTLAAGATAEQLRSENAAGLIGARETLAALGTGAGTALFGVVGGRVSRRLGLEDIDTALVSRGLNAEAAETIKQGFISSVVKSGVSEGLFEELPQSIQEQMWQNWANDRPIGQGVGKAAAQGAIAGFAMGGGFQAIGRVRNHYSEINTAQTSSQQLLDAINAAAPSALRNQSPEEFRSLVQSMAENTEGAPSQIYVDAEVLNQLAPEVLAQLPQSVRDQIPDALAANDVVSISTGDVLTVAPGTPLEQVLVENSRVGDPRAMTKVEANQAAEKAQEFFAQEAQRVIQQAADQQALQQSHDLVKQTLLDQLNAVGRDRPAVNQNTATLYASLYTTLAGELGINKATGKAFTPEEAFALYGVNVVGQTGQGGVLNAKVPNEENLYTDDEGNPVKFYHGGPTAFTGIRSGGRFGGAIFVREGRPSGYGANEQEIYIRGPILSLDQLRNELNEEAGREKLSAAVGEELDEDRADLLIEALTDGSNYPTDSDVWEIIGAVDEADAQTEIQKLRGKVSRSLGYGAVRTPDEFDGETVMVLDNAAAVLPNDPSILNQRTKQKPGPDAPGAGLEEGNKLGFWPALRVKLTGKLKLPEKAPILTGTTNANAAKQIGAIDAILKKFPKATESTAEWTKMMAYALGSTEVPIPPYAFIRDLNGTGSVDKLRTLTQGQIDDASHGFENAAEFRRAYTAGELGVETTGKLFMWSFLSRGVSPYTQEALFIDAFEGADKWIAMAARGEFTEAVFPEYEAWAKSVAPAGSGQPGAGATHNLNAFGQDFLFKMSRVGKDGKTHMQRLHDMMADPAQTGKQIRREFATFGEGVGIDNKVVSFTLLVAGFNDVMVLDRVQIRQLWDDGKFNGVNLYDGVSEKKMVTGKDGVAKLKPVKMAGSSLNSLAEGARGILVYEAIERGLEGKIQQMYTELGRPQDASIGRYHWETWVADSQQEASHGTLGAILADAKGDDLAIANVSAKQGEYGAYEYGALYNKDADGTPWFGYETPAGGKFAFSVPAFRAFLEDIKKAGTGVVPTKFKVTESGNAPWYTRTEVNQGRLEERARYWADRAGGSGEGQRAIEEALRQQVADGARSGAADQPAGQDNGVLNQGPRGTFNPATFELALNENSNMSTVHHEMAHAYLEIITKIASEPNAPQGIVDQVDRFLKWRGITGSETVGGPDSGAPLAQMPRAARAEPTGKIDLLTRKPIFNVFSESGEQVYLSRSADTAEAAVALANKVLALQAENAGKPVPMVNIDSAPAAPKEKRATNWRIVRGQTFTDFEEDDEYLYHVTKHSAAREIIKNGLVPNSSRMFGDAYAGHSANRVFLTERSGVSFWKEKVEQWSETYDWRAPAISVLRIPKAKISAKLQPDAPGSADARAPAYYAEGEVLAQDGNLPTDNTQPVRRTPLEVWNAMTLDQKRPHHEAMAENYEHYLITGKAPSVELQPLFRKFKLYMLNAYKSLKAFFEQNPDVDKKLPPEMVQFYDRMLASEEQIAQANGVAGLLPDQDADAEAVEKLTARSLRDLKWAVNARNKEIKRLQDQAKELRKGVEEQVTAEVNAMPEFRAKAALDALQVSPDYTVALNAWKEQRAAALAAAAEQIKADLLAANPDVTGLKKGQLLTKNKRLMANQAEAKALEWEAQNPKPTKTDNATDADLAVVADSFGYPDADTMLQAIDAIGKKSDVIAGMTDQRMLEEHGDLIDQRAIEEAANDAVHNEARARALAAELKSQGEMLNARTDTGQVNAAGSKITVNVLLEAAKQFAANVVSKTPIKDLQSKARQHTAAERRASKRWQEHTAKGETADAVKAKQDQMLNNAAAKAALEAQAEMRKILDFFKRVYKDGNEKTVEKGRDPDVVNAARAILGAYGAAPRASKNAIEYLALVEKNDPAMYAALQPSVQGALNLAQPLESLTMDELRSLHEEIQSMWHLAKRSRQMEVDGNLIDMQEAEDELQARMQAIGVPDVIPGETSAITPIEKAKRTLQFAGSLLRRTEQWAEGMGKEFTRLVFQPIKQAADTYRAERVKYRKAYQALIDSVAPFLKKGLIEAPELGYTFGKGHNGIGHAELLHAILHTGNASNKRKLLLGRGWATENADGTMDTSKWDAFVKRMQDTGLLTKAHYDFAQGVWDLLEQTKPQAQKTHRDVFGRYFAEVTADSFTTPFGTYAGGYVPAQADPRIVQDAALRDLATTENENMSFSFPGTNKGFTKGRVEYNRPLMLDLRTIGQHIDKVLLFTHMEPAVRDVNKLLSRKGVSYSLGRIDPTIYAGMLTPWLNRSARQIVETPIVGDGGISRVLSAARSRAGMALMFTNISNTLQQVTGFLTAMAKLKADGLESQLTRSTALYITNPRKMARSVAAASPFMASRMDNEISAINGAMNDILLDPSLYEKSQAWALKHSYFLQSAMANTMEPIIWTAGYNAALAKNLDDAEAVKYADSLIRQTQGSTLPEDVSRIETGPAYARVFTQFVGYFNMMGNTNATALKQIAQEQGLRKGAGKALGILTLGMLAPLWVAEAIAIAMRGGPEDKDDDGYLDDWLAAVLGMGTIKGSLAMVPFIGQLANAAINRFNSNPADDKMSLSPAVSLLESAVGVPLDVYNAIADPDKLNARNAVRDVASAISIVTGLPAIAFARPIGYLAGMEDDKITPTGPGDLVRGLVTGAASPESKQ